MPAAVPCDLHLVRLGPVPEGARAVLSPDEAAVAARFVRAADREAYESAHVALRVVLAQACGTDPEGVDLRRGACPACGGPHGKPYVDGGPHVSFSRTRGVAAVAVAVAEVGVDVEARLERRVAVEVAAAFTPGERDDVRGSSTPEVAATRLWVRKEAALKCVGVGLTVEPRALDVRGTTARVAAREVHLWDAVDDGDVVAHVALATAGGAPRPVVHRWGPDHVARELRARATVAVRPGPGR